MINMTAFDNAWTLLKNRGFEVDPRHEDERQEALQYAYDDIDTIKDNRERVLAELYRLSQRRRPEEEAMFNQIMREGLPSSSRRPDLRHTGGYSGGSLDQSEHELTSLLDPEGRRDQGSPYLSIPEMESETGPMYQERQRQEAEGIEAEGIDLSNGPRVSAVPPADLGRAGSLSPERPPQPWQFEKAWATLKADPNMLDSEGRSIPPALANPQNFDTTGDAERRFQSIRDAVLAAGMPYYGNLRQRLLGRIHRTPRPSAYHFLQDADEEEEQTMRQNERRFGPLGSILAQDTDKGREFYQYRGPDVSNMYAPVPQPE